MKKQIQLVLILLTAFLLSSCDEDGSIASLNETVNSNNLQELDPSDITLQSDQGSEDFPVFNWSATDYGYQAAVSYSLQVDVQGYDFGNAINLASTSDLTATMNNAQINNAMLSLGLNPGEAVPIEFRVVSNIGSGIPPVYSNNVEAMITSYPPASEPTLYIIGDAQGWNLDNALQLGYQGAGVFEGVGDFVNPGNFRFFIQPSWEAEQVGAGDFSSLPDELSAVGDGDDNLAFNGTSGVYKITVSLLDGVITIEEAETPDLFIIGGDQGWDLANAFGLEWIGGSKFTGTTNFTQNEIFRFFEAPDWASVQYNYVFFEDVDGKFENDGGGDSNFKLIEATGTYSITVDLLNKTVVVKE